MRKVKCVVVGDSAVGKTSLLVRFTTNAMCDEYTKTVFNNYFATVTMDGQEIILELGDTAGAEEYDRLRPASYPNTDILLVCFSVMSPSSFKKVKVTWFPEIKEHCRDSPVILVGTKSDLRCDTEEGQPINKQEAEALAKELGAVKYMECSAVTPIGIKELFDEAIRAVVFPNKKWKEKICIVF